MKKLLLTLLLIYLPTVASAQNNTRNPCWYLTTTDVFCQPTTPVTPLPVVPLAFNANSTPCSASTSGSGGTATPLLAASSLRKKIAIKVEGTVAVCFNKEGATAVAGVADTFCLKAASGANAGDGGSYVTPDGMTDNKAISMVSASASQLVTCWWQ